MLARNASPSVFLDAIGLFLAGLINTFLALFAAGVVAGPGTTTGQPELALRAAWIAENGLRWQGVWLFWFVVTLSFAWSYYALGRHLPTAWPWAALAIGVALVAAAVDIVGVVAKLTLVPALAQMVIAAPAGQALEMAQLFAAVEGFADALVNVAAFGLYAGAGLLLLPALFATAAYPRWLAWLGAAEWIIASLATLLLVALPTLATIPLLISFGLYAPWVWASALWLLRGERA